MQIRLSSTTKTRLEHLASNHQKTMADVIAALINQEYEDLIKRADELTDYGRNDPTE